MERGYIHITENEKHEFSVEAKLINGTLWLSQWQMATLFNVYTKTIESSLKAIFKAGLLRENEVSRIHTFVNDGRESEQILYNLDTLIFVGFRIASFEAKAFREWALKAFSEYLKKGGNKSQNVLVVLNSHLKMPIISSLN
ncbi:virulence RhuM family protein [Bacteroides sp. OttesenSCG-928-D19]|nr:virulence RhuM family protein [Bacteroides sp. OttesenSCG-928-D19]